MVLVSLRSRLSRLLKSEEGAASVEFSIWLPFLSFFLVIALDLNHAMTLNANLWQTTRDAARAAALWQVDESDIASYVDARLYRPDLPYRMEYEDRGDAVELTLSLDMGDAGLSPLLRRIAPGEMQSHILLLKEPI